MVNILLGVLAIVCTGDCQHTAFENTPVHLTNYWPFDETGELYQETNYQCADPCGVTASGYLVQDCLDNDLNCAACPLPLIDYTVEIEGITVWCVDTYGYEVYQRGIFWHEGHQQFVWGVDMMSPEDTYRVVPVDALDP